MEAILKELGLSDGYFIPVADDENKSLEIEVSFDQHQSQGSFFFFCVLGKGTPKGAGATCIGIRRRTGSFEVRRAIC